MITTHLNLIFCRTEPKMPFRIRSPKCQWVTIQQDRPHCPNSLQPWQGLHQGGACCCWLIWQRRRITGQQQGRQWQGGLHGEADQQRHLRGGTRHVLLPRQLLRRCHRKCSGSQDAVRPCQWGIAELGDAGCQLTAPMGHWQYWRVAREEAPGWCVAPGHSLISNFGFRFRFHETFIYEFVFSQIKFQVQTLRNPEMQEMQTIDSMVAYEIRKYVWDEVLYQDVYVVGRKIERVIFDQLIEDLLVEGFHLIL